MGNFEKYQNFLTTSKIENRKIFKITMSSLNDPVIGSCNFIPNAVPLSAREFLSMIQNLSDMYAVEHLHNGNIDHFNSDNSKHSINL
jgi:hypothetical protein